LARVAREQGLAQERLRKWVSFLALCGALERAVHEGILSNYYLKGGVAMKLRFAEGARATKDVDIGLAGERAERLQTFRDALALVFDEFSFQLKGKPLAMDNADAVGLEPGILYRIRAWQTIDVDHGPAGSGVVDLVEPAITGLSRMGLRIPSPVPCLNLSEQVAQKLHAFRGP
jgi:Nucleotidyl transferase AbiEii toxin, Type IV TA system